MNFLKLNTVKKLSKTAQLEVRGGLTGPEKNTCMVACMSQPNPSSYACAKSCDIL